MKRCSPSAQGVTGETQCWMEELSVWNALFDTPVAEIEHELSAA